MAEDEVSFAAKLSDQASGAAGKIASAMEEMEKSYSRAGKTMSETEKTFLGNALMMRAKAQYVKTSREWVDSLLGVSSAYKTVDEAAGASASAIGIATAGFSMMKDVVVGAIDALAGLATGFISTALEASEFKEQSTRAFEIFYDSKEEAEKAYAYSREFAKFGGFDNRRMTGAYQELAAFGFGRGESQNILAAGIDLERIMGPKASLEHFSEMIEKVGERGMFDKRTALAFQKMGVRSDDVFRELAALAHTTPDEAKLLASKAGHFSGGQIIESILKGVKSRIDKGDLLGTAGLDMAAKSPAAAFERMKTMFRTALEDTDNSPMTKLWTELGDLMDGSTEKGMNFKKTMSGIVDTVVGWVGELTKVGADGKSGLQTFFEDAMGAAKTFIGVLKDVGDAIKKVVDVYKDVKKYFSPDEEATNKYSAEAANSFVKTQLPNFGLAYGHQLTKEEGVALFNQLVNAGIYDKFTSRKTEQEKGIGAAREEIAGPAREMLAGGQYDAHFAGYEDAMNAKKAKLEEDSKVIGNQVAVGLSAGMIGGLPIVTGAADGLADEIAKSVKSKLKIQSPSKVMEGLGAFTAMGFAEGIEKGMPGVRDAFGDMMSPSDLVFSDAASHARGRGPVTIELHMSNEFHVANGDAEELAEELGPMVDRLITDAFERLALEDGVQE